MEIRFFKILFIIEEDLFSKLFKSIFKRSLENLLKEFLYKK